MNKEIFPSAASNDFDGPPEQDLAALFAGCAPPARHVDIEALLSTVAPAKVRFFNWRTPMFRRVAALMLATSGVVAIIAWLTLLGSGGQLSFAAVVEKVAQTRSVTFKMTNRSPGAPEETGRVLVLADGRLRMELSNDGYVVIDTKTDKGLSVWPRDKKAEITFAANVPSGTNIYDMLRNVIDYKNVRLHDEVLDGRKANVFRVEWEDIREHPHGWCEPMKVWVDLETKLPIRIESFTQDNQQRPESVMYDFAFDQPFDPALFSLDPPEGYEVTTEKAAIPPGPPNDPKHLAPEVKPGVGLGPVKFGMSREEVIKILGKPDEEFFRNAPPSPKEKAVYVLGDPDVEFARFIQYSWGQYGFYFDSHEEVTAAACFSGGSNGPKPRDFAGKTKEGIGIGSRLADLEKVFGKPDFFNRENPGTALIHYNRLGLWFTLSDDKVVRFKVLPPKAEEPKDDSAK